MKNFIENCNNGELPPEEQDPIDIKGVEELLGQNRSSTLIWKTKEAKIFADKNNLDLIELGGPIPELKTPNRYIIAKKEKITNLLEEKVNAYSGPFSDKMKEFYIKIKDLSVLEATKVLVDEPFNEKGLEIPEVAILEGLMFGYKPCDIEYYINTRYLGQKEHSLEDVGDKVGHVVCEKCAKIASNIK